MLDLLNYVLLYKIPLLQIDYSTDSQIFQVVNNGTITALMPLDRELNESVSFTVVATDRGEPRISASATVTVTIRDTNDNAPQFESTLPSPVTIRETEPINYTIGLVRASDADEADTVNSAIRYSITGGSGEGVFGVNAETGILTLTATLDFENTSTYDLNVTATDQGMPPLNTTIVLAFEILDGDDNIPLFLRQTYEFSLLENNTVGAFVGRVEARDVDPLGQVIGYAITAWEPSLPFEINITTGEIFANTSINRESLVDQTAPHFTLTVAAFYQDTPEDITSTATVRISILDLNEFRVTINSFELDTIAENTAVGTRVGTVVATDRDPTSNLRYSITVALDMLIIDQAGRIFVDGQIDRESPVLSQAFCPQNTPLNTSCLPVVVSVQDQTTNMSVASFAVLLVTDLDDEPPVFSRNLYTLNISESTTPGTALPDLSIAATDPDYNVVLRYSIPSDQGVSDFRIQQASGLIIVAQTLDYESTRDYRFTIVTEDSQGNQDNATVVIYIIDENDNTPVFNSTVYSETIPENFPVNDAVLTVRATDRDSTSNSDLTYYITAGNTGNAFRIDSQTGVISLHNSLNREVNSSYALTVEAVDAGSPQLTGSATVNIMVSDVNDHPPRFLQAEYRGFIDETAATGDRVLDSSNNTLIISYDDPDEGAVVTITFLGTYPFTIDSSTGIVTVDGALDFEQTPSYTIVMSIRDDLGLHGAPATLIINLRPFNDHPPQFDQESYTLTLPENSRGGETVLRVRATDRDGAEVITYRIDTDFIEGDIDFPEPSSGMLQSSGYEEENVTFPFEIGSLSGEVNLTRDLDYETAREWDFSIVATDLGGLETRASVVVTVSNLNDNAPRFAEHIFSITVPEDFSPSREVPASMEITATDADTENGEGLLFFILNGAEGLFEMDRQTGYLYIIRSLDVRRVYNIQLVVTDGQNEDTAVARVRVMDINNNAPVFSQNAYSAVLLEFSPPGTSVLTVEATDADLGIFADISYFLVPSVDASSFYINQTNGEIITASGTSFDHNIQSVFQFQVEARDSADTPRVSRVNVTVTIGDVNNNAPVFTQDPFMVLVSETTAVGMEVFRLTATDADVGIADAQIYFSLLTQNSSFVVEETGIVRVASELDFDDPAAPKQITLEISANDRGMPPLNSTGRLVINITDENDNPPTFPAPLIQILIPENATVNDQVFVIRATDLDSGVNSEITYTVQSILPENCETRFSVASTGVVTLREEVDAEAGEPCTLVVRATDNGTPSLFTQAAYVVIVTNINEFAPVVDPNSLIGQIPENSPNGTFVLQITATDRDGNGITYQPVGGDIAFFDVSESGRVTVGDLPLDREQNETYRIQVEVKDDGLPVLRVYGGYCYNTH